MITQRTGHDCAICTIAMALDRTYDEVMAAGLATKAFDPMRGCSSEYSIIESFGLKQMHDFRLLWRDEVLAPAFFRHFSWGRRAILAVPSLNKVGGWHSVYFDGAKVRDPNEGVADKKFYTRWEDLLPNEIILFAERGPHPRGP